MDGVETIEYYTGSGTLFGSGTNESGRASHSELMRRINIVKYLTAHRGRKLNAIALGYLKSGTLSNSFSLTQEGWAYWKDESLPEESKC